MSFNDATCLQCKRKIHWTGEFKDRPPCPNCGHQISLQEIEEVERKLEEARREMLDEFDDEEE